MQMSQRMIQQCSQYQGNVEHCGASMSKHCTTALTVMQLMQLLPVKYQITAHRPFMHGMQLNEVVTLLSTKVLNSLEKLSWLQRRAFHGIVPHNIAICPTSTQLLRLLQLQAKSEHSLACTVLQDLRHLREIVEGSRHASAMEQNLCCLLHSVSCMSLSTTTVSPCTLTE